LLLHRSGCRSALGCFDAFTARIEAPQGFPAGTHEVEIMADGWETTCTFQLPLPRFKGGDPENPSCSPSLMLWFDSATGDEVMTIMGTPRALRIRQVANGVVVFDQMSTPTYSSEQPNGPLCPPTCYYAGATWSLASSDGGLDSRAGDSRALGRPGRGGATGARGVRTGRCLFGVSSCARSADHVDDRQPAF
jgi:hypothetical protein